MSPSNRPPARPGAGGQAGAVGGPVGNDPDQFIEGGLATDFDGQVVEARTCVWNYDNGNGPKTDDAGNSLFTLAVRTTIKRADGEKDVYNWWSAGDPTHFAPSMDGLNPSPVDPQSGCSEGVYWVRTGSKSALNNNTNYAQALQALKDAGFKGAFEADIRFLESVYGHWDRVPQRQRPGLNRVAPEEGQQGRGREVLVCTLIKQAGAAASRPAPAARQQQAPPARPTPTAAPPAASTGNGEDLDTRLLQVVLAKLPTDGTAIPKGQLAGAVLQATSLAQNEKAKAVPRITSAEFLNAGMEAGLWVFDASTNTIQGLG